MFQMYVLILGFDEEKIQTSKQSRIEEPKGRHDDVMMSGKLLQPIFNKTILYECTGLTEARNKWRANYVRVAIKIAIPWPTPLLPNQPLHLQTIENALGIPNKEKWKELQQNPHLMHYLQQAIHINLKGISTLIHTTKYLHNQKFAHKLPQIKREKQKNRTLIPVESKLANKLEKQKLKKIIKQKLEKTHHTVNDSHPEPKT